MSDIHEAEQEAERLIQSYYSTVWELGLNPLDARRLERLIHAKPKPRVVEFVALEGTEAEGEQAQKIVAPGSGLAALTDAERSALVALTREYYDTPSPKGIHPELQALYDKTRATLNERIAEREHMGWSSIPTWTEWATARKLPRAVIHYGHVAVCGGRTNILRSPTPIFADIDGFTIWRPEIVERVVTLYESLRAEEAKRARARPNRPSLRQGTHFLATLAQSERHVTKERRKHVHTDALQPHEVEALKLFRYQPLKWAERLVVTALANIALAEKKLDAHPAALATRPLEDAPMPRIRVEFPGFAELAKWCGAKPGGDGRIPKDFQRTLERALRNLARTPRWIVEPILVREKKGKKTELVPRLRVSQALWVEASAIFPTGANPTLDLHPAAVGSLRSSFVDRGTDLYERYEAARNAIGARKMRDEWGNLEGYLLWQAGIKAGDERKHLASTPEGTPEGTRTLTLEVERRTLWETLELDAVARKQGRKSALQREAEALAFCKAMGTLLAVEERAGKADTVLVCTVPHPDRAPYDPDQLTLVSPSTPGMGGE
jgi:hypothetical protein